ncbi:MAG: endonuclease III [Saprospiraceae bacterium]|nr:endonuclease III [Saprospiraceae bacterium]MBK9721663.1 endonuclease III [Saprospiraceae bacterium]
MIRLSKKEKAIEIAKILDHLFPEPSIPLFHQNSFTLLIAVLLSAQCTDERVNKVTPALFALADNPNAMVQIPIEQIQEIIKICGLSGTKSKAINRLSEILIQKFNGEIPDNIIDLESLPGVGHKTASVIMAQIFGVPSFPVDTHIHRLAHRWGLSSGKNVVQTEMDLMKVFDKSIWNKVHLQIIYYGRKYCQARGHHIEACPICLKFGKKLS